MNEQEAREEAVRLWGAHGPWVETYHREQVNTDRWGAVKREVVTECVVGIHRPDGQGHVQRMEIGSAGTFEEAMAKAADWWAKQVPRKVHHTSPQERAEKAGGFPMAGNLLDGVGPLSRAASAPGKRRKGA